jgi:7-keto-8-aminopelargonate synthetase-like enzyme
LKKYGVGSCGPRGFYGTMGKFIYQNIETEAQTHVMLIQSRFLVYDIDISTVDLTGSQ